MLDQVFHKFRKAEMRKWVGDLPEGWTLVRNQGLFDETKTIGCAGEELLSVTIEYGIIPQTEITTKKDSSNEDKSKYKLLEPGDLAYNKMRMWQGAIGRSDRRGIVSPAYVVIRPRDPDYSRYFHYLYRTHRFITEANRNSYGLCDDMNTLRYEDFKTIYSPVPPKDTMFRIVSFLDEKVAEIDAAIGKKRRLIDLLNEQKSILINRAVSKGLNPSSPMKDSGVDWIGEIPTHWNVLRGKYLFNEIDERSQTGTEELLSVSHTTGVTPRSEKKISMFMAEDYTGSKICRPGDAVFNIMWAWMGALGVSEHLGIVSPSYGVYRPKSRKLFNNWYLEHLLRSWGYVQEYNRRSTGLHSSRLRLYADMFFAMEIGFPPRNEQDEIEHSVKARCSIVDDAILSSEHEVVALNEFKQTLIANGVTGKIKI